MKRTIILSVIAILLTAFSLGYFFWLRPAQIEQKVSAENEPPKPNKSTRNLVVAPGVVEPISEEIEVGAEISGKIKQVLVEEGEQVFKGQTIAVLENADFEANVAAVLVNREELERGLQDADSVTNNELHALRFQDTIKHL